MKQRKVCCPLGHGALQWGDMLHHREDGQPSKLTGADSPEVSPSLECCCVLYYMTEIGWIIIHMAEYSLRLISLRPLHGSK